MTGRLLLVLLAALCAAVAVGATRSDRRCAATVERAKGLTSDTPEAVRRTLVQDTLDRCDSEAAPIQVAAALLFRKHTDDAVHVLVSLIRRQPDDYLAWFALARVSPDKGQAGRALVRAHALNPRTVPGPGT